MELETAIRSYYDYVDAEEYEALFDLFASKIVYHRSGQPTIRGFQDFKEFYLTHRPLSEGSHTVDELHVDDRSVVVRGRFEGILRDEHIKFGFADVHHFNEQGLISERWTYTDLGAV
ncbi:nuclear transport factor 2 family protein [Haladaptatus sp. CMAA 1911]|uniref:nuclear transport factor 2 family protein n=1 Tax=unclassified Haladaptatus TaxID=2622732 RepID=UPI0037542D33